MSDKNITDPAGLFSLSKDMLAAQQKFLPSGRIFAQLAETARTITQAQIAYSQTVMRAQAALLAALMEMPAPTDDDFDSATRAERPSKAAHRADISTS